MNTFSDTCSKNETQSMQDFAFSASRAALLRFMSFVHSSTFMHDMSVVAHDRDRTLILVRRRSDPSQVQFSVLRSAPSERANEQIDE